MARGNRWKNFGDAFNATYGAVTTIGRDMETLKVNRDYPTKDAEGNDLTGAGLMEAQRARYNALANIEDKYGTAANALAIRQGLEQYTQANDQTRLLGDTYNERVFQQGAGASGLLRAQTAQASSAAGLNSARARGQDISNQEAAAVLESKIAAGIATNEETRLAAELNSRMYADPRYANAKVDAEIANQIAIAQERYRDTNRATAEGLAASTGAYQKSLESGYEATTALNNLNTYNNQTSLRRGQQPEVVAAGDQQAVIDAQRGLVDARNTMLASEATNRLASNQVVQDNNFQTGVNESVTGLAQSQITSNETQHNAKISNVIYDFMATVEDAGSPESMNELLTRLSKVDRNAAATLRASYSDAELSDLLVESTEHKSRAMAALVKDGAQGLLTYLDQADGELDGSVVFEENAARNGGGQYYRVEKDGTRTPLFGGDNATALQNAVNLALDPATMFKTTLELYKSRASGAGGDQGVGGAVDPLALARGIGPLDPNAFGWLGGKSGLDVPDPLGGGNTDGKDTAPDPLAFNPVSPPQSPDAFASAAESLFDGSKSPAEILDGLSQNRQGLSYFQLYQPYVERATAMESISNLILRNGVDSTLSRIAESENAVGREVISDPRLLAIVVQDMGAKLKDQNELLAQRYANYNQNHPQVVRVREEQAARQQSLQRMVERLQQLISDQNAAP
jgi:hypothetical protein